MKKSVKLLVAAFGSLCLCWFIGQQLRVLRPELVENESLTSEVAQQEQQQQEQSQEQVEQGSQGLFANLEFEGSKDTSDNPWMKTAGLFEMENLGKCIFLTPNTGVVFGGVSYGEAVALECGIHPWVIESSDGAGLVMWVLDDQDNILYQEEWNISNQDEWQTVTLPLQNYEAAAKVKILCNNGKNEDDSGDWVIIRMAQ